MIEENQSPQTTQYPLCEPHLDYGAWILDRRSTMRADIKARGRMGLESLVGALINSGVEYESDLVREVEAIAGPEAASEVPELLGEACSNCQLVLWDRLSGGQYRLQPHV